MTETAAIAMMPNGAVRQRVKGRASALNPAENKRRIKMIHPVERERRMLSRGQIIQSKS
ncbi:hypothetical protein [Sphingomonas nostoxanthinifaciens]|uniref:hypothetical protein n=1 Tax=Sphingomonas nostoxanthinifaciens TaxID=2872652 RepID=UPI001CC21D4E|nr:hypothetical protein [Sphingomonas nostoxanthinifaciens]UAK25898.1 hypothetical protein K8P63_07190 [Sphingomonas nostoxanthinifaciens]